MNNQQPENNLPMPKKVVDIFDYSDDEDPLESLIDGFIAKENGTKPKQPVGIQLPKIQDSSFRLKDSTDINKFSTMKSLDFRVKPSQFVESSSSDIAPKFHINVNAVKHENSVAAHLAGFLNMNGPVQEGSSATRTRKSLQRMSSIAKIFSSDRKQSNQFEEQNNNHELPSEPQIPLQIQLVESTTQQVETESQACISKPKAASNQEHSFTDADSQLDESYDGEKNHVARNTCKNKRTRKAKRKLTAATRSSTIEEDKVDHMAIAEAIAQHQMRPPDQPRRGRKPVKEDKYISDSLKSIAAMEQRLIDEKGSLTPDERDQLRNKASALRSRVNRKIEQRSFVSKLEDFKSQFSLLSSIMAEELDNATKLKVMERLSQTMSAATQKRARRQASVSRPELMKKFDEFIKASPSNRQ